MPTSGFLFRGSVKLAKVSWLKPQVQGLPSQRLE